LKIQTELQRDFEFSFHWLSFVLYVSSTEALKN